ncbi:MAG: four helix bundle protein [Bacteroidetes bacterium]|nr:four helix bundle protein [Bacteroidota bacterium]
MNPKTQELLDRTFRFGVRILKFLKTLPDDYIYRIPKGQLARAGLSIGSNYEEAQGAISKRDFANKISICYRESRESVYWLRVLKELYPEEKYIKDFVEFINEGIELKKIFGSIKKSSTENPNR